MRIVRTVNGRRVSEAEFRGMTAQNPTLDGIFAAVTRRLESKNGKKE